MKVLKYSGYFGNERLTTHTHTNTQKLTCATTTTHQNNTCIRQQHKQQQKHMDATTTTIMKNEYLHLGQSLAIAPILPLACG